MPEKIDPIVQPIRNLASPSEAKKALRKVTAELRILTRIEDTLSRRNDANSKSADAEKEIVNERLAPLLDQVFWYVFSNWDDLITGNATENVKFDEAQFKRYIDKVGSLVINQAVLVPYLLTIKKSSFAKQLKRSLGEKEAKSILKQLRELVTFEKVPVIDTDKLKKMLVGRVVENLEGADVSYTNTLTMTPTQSPSQKRRGRATIRIKRTIP
jgi:hypothetical protein